MTNQVSLDKHPTGVPGLDMLLDGGIPRYSFVLLTGTSGSGKTSLAHQIMFSLVKNRGTALYFTILGEPPLKMLRFQQQYSFFDAAQVGTNMKYVNLADDLQKGGYDGVLDRIMDEVENFQPQAIFIDSFRSALQVPKKASKKNAKHGSDFPSFMQKLAVHLATWQATTFLVGDFAQEERDAHPIFTISDCVIELSREHDANATLRKIHIPKLRGSGHMTGQHAFRINQDGLKIFPPLSALQAQRGRKLEAPRTGARLSTGIDDLDTMLSGGIPAGNVILLAGPPGSGKSLLATSFLAAGAQADEHGVIALFTPFCFTSRHRRLQELIAGEHVTVFAPPCTDMSIDEMMTELSEVIQRTGARRVVLDSLDTLGSRLARQYRHDFQEALFRTMAMFSEQHITVVMTKNVWANPADLGNEGIVADGVILLREVESGNQLSRQIVVPKLRGNAHSEAIRPYRLSESGMHIEQELP